MKEQTMELLERKLVERLEGVDTMAYDSKERSILHRESMDLVDKIVAAEHEAYEYFDKEDKRAIERQKIETNVEIEKTKADVNWKRFVLEAGKVVVPVVVAVLGHIAYDKYQARVMEYEKDGTIRTTAGRGLRLPNIL